MDDFQKKSDIWRNIIYKYKGLAMHATLRTDELIELPSWFIRLFTKENDVVLDPFIGSGTTAVSAVLHGRKYLGIELKPEYFEEAVKNIDEAEKLMRSEKNKASSKS